MPRLRLKREGEDLVPVSVEDRSTLWALTGLKLIGDTEQWRSYLEEHARRFQVEVEYVG